MASLKDKAILMVSLDPGLLKAAGAGDSLERHKKYAEFVDRLDIILFSRLGRKEVEVTNNFKIYAFPNTLSGYKQAMKKAHSLFALRHYDLVDTQDPHMSGKFGLKLKEKYGAKLEVHFHGDFWNNPHWRKESFKNIFYNILQKKIVAKADAIRVVNQRIKNKLVKAGISESKMAVISTPVNEAVFADENFAEGTNEFGDKKVILFVGRLAAAKNLFFTYDVIKKLSEKRDDFVFVVIGGGEQQAELEKKISDDKLSDFIKMLGPKDQADILPYYKQAYISLLLSTNESFGKVIIESGFAGVPTLASRAIGPSEVISDGVDGWLVDINDMEASVEKLDHLLSDKDEVQTVGQRTRREFMEKYSQSASFAKVKKFWEEIIL